MEYLICLICICAILGFILGGLLVVFACVLAGDCDKQQRDLEK